MNNDFDKESWLIAKIEEAYRFGWEETYHFYQKQYRQEFGGKNYLIDSVDLTFYE